MDEGQVVRQAREEKASDIIQKVEHPLRADYEYTLRKWIVVIPWSERVEPKPLYVCPGYSIHTYSNNMIRCNVQ
jgi:hypothetical protein